MNPFPILRLWRIGLFATVLAWMGLIFYLSSLSQPEVSRPLESGAISWAGDLRSYVAHAVLYGVLALIVQISIWGWIFGNQLRLATAAAAIAALYGISDEYHQSFVTGRTGTLEDVAVNTAAAILAAFGLWVLSAGTATVRLREVPFGGFPESGGVLRRYRRKWVHSRTVKGEDSYHEEA